MARSVKRSTKTRSQQGFAGGGRTLAVIAFAALCANTGTGVCAQTVDEAMANKPIDSPTLDYLKEQGIQIPQTDGYDSDTGLFNEGTPIASPESAYTMTEVSETGDNVITTYETVDVTRYYDKTTGELVENPQSGVEYKVVQEKDLVPHYYKIDLKQTTYGEGGESKTFTWVEDSNGNKTFVEITKDGDKYYTSTTDYHGNVTKTEVTPSTIITAKWKAADERITNTSDTPSTNIEGTFINNEAPYMEEHTTVGGAILNYKGTLGDITGKFIGNYAGGAGGAIGNNGTISNITGDFIGNDASYGGAIFNNYGTIGNITGNFIGNSNGAIYNHGTINNITGDFIGNYAFANTAAYGGAIVNTYKTKDYSSGTYDSTIGNITGDFIGNYAYATGYTDWHNKYHPGYAYGGAIYNNYSVIGNITGDFIGNSTTGGIDSAGGAIANVYGSIYDITGNFINNKAEITYQTAYDSSDADYVLDGDSSGSAYTETYADGGAIYNYGTIGNINSNFYNNTVLTPSGYASGGAIYNAGTTKTISGTFKDNGAMGSENAVGGAIYNEGDIEQIKNSSFINNYALSDVEAQGGAIYTTTDLDMVSDNYHSVISGNYTEKLSEDGETYIKDDNAIYVGDSSATLNFDMQNGGSVLLQDNIDGATTETTVTNDDGTETTTVDAYNVVIKGDDIDKTTFYLQNDIRNADVTFDNTTINTINNDVHVYDFNSLTLNSDTNMVADVDLAKGEMDRFTANSYGEHKGNLNVVGMNMLSDLPTGKDSQEIFFAQQGLKDNVVNKISETPTAYQTTAYTPIFKYNVQYDNRDDGGYFAFTRGDKIFVPNGNGGGTTVPTGNISDAFNPSVLASPVAAQTGATSSMQQVFNYSFQNADNFMNIPYLERISMKNANKYALSPTGDATDVGTFSPLFTERNSNSVWVKPYATFENIPLKNGPKVSNITYGTLVGFDTAMESTKHGWDRVWTGYIGYNGASQRYSGVDSTQNGGLLGATLTMYKGNFFNATTVSAGASVASNDTMYGHENFTMLMAGIGNKTGYNFEFKEGKFIVQPNLLLSYTFVNTFDYTNAAGVRMNSDPLHAIQIAPGVKFIGNFKGGWQPYIGVNMVWNLLDKSDVTANSVKLPEMSIKPYVQYGVGLQKRFKDDKCMAFGQAMIQNGGRNGISLSAGFRWALGRDGKKIDRTNEKVSLPAPKITLNGGVNTLTSANGSEGLSSSAAGVKSEQICHDGSKSVQASAPQRKVIKQLTSAQRTALGAKPQNTTRTTTVGILKQL